MPIPTLRETKAAFEETVAPKVKSFTRKHWVLVQVECEEYESPVGVFFDSVDAKDGAARMAVFDAKPSLLRTALQDLEPPGLVVLARRDDIEAVAKAVMSEGVREAASPLLRLLNAPNASLKVDV